MDECTKAEVTPTMAYIYYLLIAALKELVASLSLVIASVTCRSMVVVAASLVVTAAAIAVVKVDLATVGTVPDVVPGKVLVFRVLAATIASLSGRLSQRLTPVQNTFPGAPRVRFPATS